MKTYQVKIRRDANTITPEVVPEHEIPILQTIFGTENVQNLNGQSIEQAGLTEADVAGEFGGDPAVEFERLTSRYGGSEDGPIVEQVYGKKATRGLETRISDNLAREAKEAGEAPTDKGKKPAAKKGAEKTDGKPADPVDGPDGK